MKEKTLITTTFLAIEGKLRSYLKRFLIRQQDVEDAVQETFLRAYESEKKNPIHSPKSFLFRIAKNFALSELSRKTNRMVETIGDIEELNVIRDKSAVSEKYEMDRFFESLVRVVDKLPPKCRRVLIMRKVYGFSHKEIAERLDISIKTVEKHLSKALKRCQELESQGIPEFGSAGQDYPSYDGKSMSVWSGEE